MADNDDYGYLSLREYRKDLKARGVGIYIYKNKRGERRAKYYLTTYGSTNRMYYPSANTPEERRRWIGFVDYLYLHNIALQELMEIELIEGLVIDL